MDFDRFIEFVGDNAEVVAILLTVLLGALVLKLLTDVIMWIADCFSRKRRCDYTSPVPFPERPLYEPPGNAANDRPESRLEWRAEPTERPDGPPLEWTGEEPGPPVEMPLRFLAAELDGYRRLFLGREAFCEGRKSVYISPELHRRVCLHMHALAGKERATISGFIERVVCEHLNDYKQAAGRWIHSQK